MGMSNIIEGGVEIMAGIIIAVIMAGFVAYASTNENISALMGVPLILTLVVYVFVFALIVRGYKTIKGGK
jgi:hypothetical protein